MLGSVTTRGGYSMLCCSRRPAGTRICRSSQSLRLLSIEQRIEHILHTDMPAGWTRAGSCLAGDEPSFDACLGPELRKADMLLGKISSTAS